MKLVLAIVLAAVLALAGAGGFLYLTNRPGPPPPSLTVTSRGQAEAPSQVEGTYRVEAPESFVGYRVQEEFLTRDLPNEAVGRTSAIEGTMTIQGARVIEAMISADLRELESDEAGRDRAIRTRGLESAEFPEASFILTAPIEVDLIPAPGALISASATGELALHGQTCPVEIPLEAVLAEDGTIRVVGNLEIQFSDYGIEAPNVAGTISIRDEGTIELDLLFVPA
jgi:polyisoprenoid-binding protein YceI